MPRIGRESKKTTTPTRDTNTKTSGGSKFFYGRKAGRDMCKVEEAKQAAKSSGRVNRFFVNKGGSTEFIVCDSNIDFYMHEHNYADARGIYKEHCGCVKQQQICPVCTKYNESYYAFYLTIIDLSSYTSNSGNKVEFSKKLLCVKQNSFSRFFKVEDKHGTLRGALFEVARGNKSKSCRIGDDIDFVEFVEESEMKQYVSTWKNSDGGKTVTKCYEPYNYAEEIFSEPDIKTLNALMGAEPVIGSEEDLSGIDDFDDEDEDDSETHYDGSDEDTEVDDSMYDTSTEDSKEEEATEEEPKTTTRRRRGQTSTTTKRRTRK